MNLKSKKLLAARLLDVGIKRIWLDPTKASDIKESITKEDIRGLVSSGVILVKPVRSNSRGRVRQTLLQKRKGRGIGPGTKKGKKGARLSRKQKWINTIRAQRNLFNELIEAEVIARDTYRHLRSKSKGGFFRSRRHIKLYLTEHSLWKGKK